MGLLSNLASYTIVERERERKKMDDEIKNFIKVWIIANTCFCYSYYISSHIPKGIPRLLSLLPILYIFTILPLTLSSFHLGGPTVFFLVWLANFKLLLFSFNLGPLSSNPQLPFLHFISIASLPIKINQNPSPKSSIHQNPYPILSFSIKFLLFLIIICVYDYKNYIHPNAVLALYCCHMYLALEIVLAMVTAPARAIFGFELEPYFNQPYLATSLQDFWGRRWNLMVTSILRPTVHEPVRRILGPILGYKWALLLAMWATFLVSGLMHELIYFYLTRVSPTWEVTRFFVLHGVCTSIEVVLKKAAAETGMWRLHRVVSGFSTLTFLVVTGFWLFFPQLLRNGVDEKAIGELSFLKEFVRHKVPNLLHWHNITI